MAVDQSRIKALHTAGERSEGMNQGSFYTSIVKGSHVGKSEFRLFFFFYAGSAPMPAVKGSSCRLS